MNASKKELLHNRWTRAMQLNYGVPQIVLDRGNGAIVWDVDGNRYLDFLGGIATNILGHNNPSVGAAVNKQMKQLSHVSNLYIHEGGVVLAERLQKMVGDDSARTFFCNSGTEANEAALKISRLTGKTRLISTMGSFHGRTMGALSLTGQSSKRAPFIPLLKGTKFLPYGDLKAMERAITRSVAMVMIEPIQGENGVIVPPAGYLKGVRELCDNSGVLLCFDAVQTGMGRTGNWFGFEQEKVLPDIITLAKGLGGGLPLGAMITVGSAVPHFKPGEHGSTFGGNPVSVAAGNAVLDVLERREILKKIPFLEKLLKSELSRIDGVLEVRGRGLLLGIVLRDSIGSELVIECAKNGLLVNAPDKSVIRIAPPLIITERQVKEFIKKFAVSIAALSSQARIS